MRIFENTGFNIVESRKIGYVISGILLLLSVGAFLFRGLELGIDFRGGKEFVVESTQLLEATDVRAVLTEVMGQVPEVKTYSDVSDMGDAALLIRTLDEGETTVIQNQIVEGIEAAFPGSALQ